MRQWISDLRQMLIFVGFGVRLCFDVGAVLGRQIALSIVLGICGSGSVKLWFYEANRLLNFDRFFLFVLLGDVVEEEYTVDRE